MTPERRPATRIAAATSTNPFKVETIAIATWWVVVQSLFFFLQTDNQKKILCLKSKDENNAIWYSTRRIIREAIKKDENEDNEDIDYRLWQQHVPPQLQQEPHNTKATEEELGQRGLARSDDLDNNNILGLFWV